MAIRTASFLGLDASLLIRTLSSNFNQPAKRPLITGLQIEKARTILGFSPSNFEEGLRKTFNAT
jgi:dTDP-4-dehydrorhamnose reductase